MLTSEFLNNNDHYIIAVPAVTDDNGYLGYLWKAIVYFDREINGDFAGVSYDDLYNTPSAAIESINNIS